MSLSLQILPLIGVIVALCQPVSAMRDEKKFLDKYWSDSLNETLKQLPVQAANANHVHAQKRMIVAESRTDKYGHNFTPISDTSRDPDRELFSARIYDEASGEQFYVGLPSRDHLRAFQWSHGTAYAFVLDDQVYYVPTPEKQPIRISNEEEGMLHGSFDWVYNEEIFGREQIRNGAMWFSPRDKYLAYASRASNSSKEIMMTTYTQGEKYDYNYNMEYPKTGEQRMASVSVSIWSVEENKSKKMEVQLSDIKAFHYLFGVSWVTLYDKEFLLTTWANRWQNETSLTLCCYETGTCSLIYEHKYERGQWASPDDYAKTVHSDSSVFIILPEARGDNAWQHISKIEITEDFRFKTISFLPSEDYDIKEILTYRRDENVVSYRAQAPHPWNMHVYAVAATGDGSGIKEEQCLTCNEDNSTQTEWKIETFLLPNGFEANVKIYIGDSRLASVPATLLVYGGPNDNQVVDKYEQVPTPIGGAIIYIDVRGSGGRGWKYRSEIYGRLLTVEVEDTIEAMKMILAKYPRMDKNRVAVYGWSYGGSMAISLVEMAPKGFFKCALAGAPVTNFNSYDATYTERFMADTPSSSYVDLTEDVSKFQHTKLLLIHGMRDDNVHFQNSALLIEKLQQATIPFQLMVYPNKAHSFNSWHLEQLKDTFFGSCYA